MKTKPEAEQTMKKLSVRFRITDWSFNWIKGEFRGKLFSAKIYPYPSPYGINNGRVSKLEYDGIRYERGWALGESRDKEWGPLARLLEKFAQTKRFKRELDIK